MWLPGNTAFQVFQGTSCNAGHRRNWSPKSSRMGSDGWDGWKVAGMMIGGLKRKQGQQYKGNSLSTGRGWKIFLGGSWCFPHLECTLPILSP